MHAIALSTKEQGALEEDRAVKAQRTARAGTAKSRDTFPKTALTRHVTAAPGTKGKDKATLEKRTVP